MQKCKNLKPNIHVIIIHSLFHPEGLFHVWSNSTISSIKTKVQIDAIHALNDEQFKTQKTI